MRSLHIAHCSFVPPSCKSCRQPSQFLLQSRGVADFPAAGTNSRGDLDRHESVVEDHYYLDTQGNISVCFKVSRHLSIKSRDQLYCKVILLISASFRFFADKLASTKNDELLSFVLVEGRRDTCRAFITSFPVDGQQRLACNPHESNTQHDFSVCRSHVCGEDQARRDAPPHCS